MARKKYPCPHCLAQNLKQALNKCNEACDRADESNDDSGGNFNFVDNEVSGAELLNIEEQ